MRCKFCGSESIRQDTEHKNFSTGKAVAGAVAFGIVGAVTGFIGKDISGYRCGACGAFMEMPMDVISESSINRAISDAESGKDRSMYDYFKKQYVNISANIPVQIIQKEPYLSMPSAPKNENLIKNSSKQKIDENVNTSKIKHIIINADWFIDSPVYIEKAIITTDEGEDFVSFVGMNQSQKIIRSIYISVQVMDDTLDEIGNETCVYQNITCGQGDKLPDDKTFSLHTSIAYSVKARIDKVAFEDGSVWRSDNSNNVTLTQQIELTDDNFPLIKQLHREHLALKSSANKEIAALFMPVFHDEYWQCICGSPVKNGQICSSCGESEEHMNKILDQKYLTKRQKEYVYSIAKKRSAKAIKLYESAENEVKAIKEEAEEKKRLQEAKAKKTAEIKEKIKEIETEITKIKKEIKQLEVKKNSRVSAEIEIEKIHEKIRELNSQIYNLGFFKGKEKKRLNSEIDILSGKLPSLEERVKEQQKALKDEYEPIISDLNKKIEDLKEQKNKLNEELKSV